QPSRTAFEAGSWVRFDDPTTGRTRFGVVTADPAAYDGPAPQVPARTRVRYIVPNDGGEAVPLARRPVNGALLWMCQRPEWPAPVKAEPALVQDGLFELPVTRLTADSPRQQDAA
ncbi:hypothetical protein G3I76_14775, partial [Streptomyces sp. SID11233]|nr:hypothetical protein [Streptomyces sp. SID11233]